MNSRLWCLFELSKFGILSLLRLQAFTRLNFGKLAGFIAADLQLEVITMSNIYNTRDHSRQAPLNEIVRACHQMASTIGTSFNDEEIEPIISAVQQEPSFAPLRDVKVAIVDDSRAILRSAIPVLLAATSNNTTVIHVDPSKDFTPTQIVDAIVSSGASWVLLDAELGQDFSGPDLARLLQEQHPAVQCVGFSSLRWLFDGAPVKASIQKWPNEMRGSLRKFAEFVADVKPLAQPELIIAISILCQAVMATSGDSKALACLGATDNMAVRAISPEAHERVSNTSMWREALAPAAGDLLSRVAAEVGDLTRFPALQALIRGLVDSSSQQITTDEAMRAYQEITKFMEA